MKVVVKPIEMVTWTDMKGNIHPVRFRMQQDDESYLTVKVEKVLFAEEQKLAGNRIIIYRCQSKVSGVQKVFEIKYEISTCKWILFKI